MKNCVVCDKKVSDHNFVIGETGEAFSVCSPQCAYDLGCDDENDENDEDDEPAEE